MTRITHYRNIMALVVLLSLGSFVLFCGSASAALKGLPLDFYGEKVDATTGANFCTLLSGDTCQAGEASSAVGGFGPSAPSGVAVAPNGNIYATDPENNRVQEITPSGAFVLMFGREVNETKTNAVVAKGGTPTRTEIDEENVCTQTEIEGGAKCTAGKADGEAGAFSGLRSIAVDPTSGNVYVTEHGEGNNRVDEFTGTGRFVLMIGKEVNETTGSNLCTQTEVETGAKCKAAVGIFGVAFSSPEHGAFALGTGGDEIAVGGPSDLVYIGSEHRVQEFESNGTWAGEISMESISSDFFMIVQGIAVEQATGNVYLTYSFFNGGNGRPASTIYELRAGGGEETFFLSAREPGASINVEGIALDSSGRLTVIEQETLTNLSTQVFGSIRDATTGIQFSEFEIPPSGAQEDSAPGLAFNKAGELYGAVRERHEVVGYVIREGTELIATTASSCQEGVIQGTSVTFGCTLNGEVNPSNVSETEVWFQWGTTSKLNGPGTQETPKQSIATGNMLVPINAPIEGLRPNETYYFKVAAYDHNFRPPTPALISETVSFKTQTVPPRIIGDPSVSFVKTSSAVMFAELNPENTNTKYHFEYGTPEALAKCPHGIAKESCPGVSSTAPLSANTYAQIGVTQEATGLQPSTTYRFRLTALNENEEQAVSATGGLPSAGGEFTTAPSPLPQARTMSHGAVTSTSAVITGEVDPDGQPAVYAFELGVDKGESTQYAIIFSGSVGKSTTFIPEELQVTGLQPGTKYAYRISIQSAYTPGGEPLKASPERFETSGALTLLAPPPVPLQLPLPRFEKQLTGGKGAAKCRRGLKRNKHGACVKPKKRKKAHKPHHHK